MANIRENKTGVDGSLNPQEEIPFTPVTPDQDKDDSEITKIAKKDLKNISKARKKARIAYNGLDEQLKLRIAKNGASDSADPVVQKIFDVRDELTKAVNERKETDIMAEDLRALIEQERSGEAIRGEDLTKLVFNILGEVENGNYRRAHLQEVRIRFQKILEGKSVQLTNPDSLKAFFNDLHAAAYGGKKEALARAYGENFIDPETPAIAKKDILEAIAEMQYELEALLVRSAVNAQSNGNKITFKDAIKMLNYLGEQQEGTIDSLKDLKRSETWRKWQKGIVLVFTCIGLPALAGGLSGSVAGGSFEGNGLIAVLYLVGFFLLLLALGLWFNYQMNFHGTELKLNIEEDRKKVMEPYANIDISNEEQAQKILQLLRAIVHLQEVIEKKRKKGINTAKEEEEVAILFERMKKLTRPQTLRLEDDLQKINLRITDSDRLSDDELAEIGIAIDSMNTKAQNTFKKRL